MKQITFFTIYFRHDKVTNILLLKQLYIIKQGTGDSEIIFTRHLCPI